MDDELEAICDLIFEMACDVNEACFYLADSSVEKQYQACMAYEMNKAKLNYHSETTIELLYKDFPLKDVRADFVLNPGGKNKFSEDIIIEVKHSDHSKANKDKARLQLFNYLFNAPKHASPMLSKLRIGLVIHWTVQDPKKLWDGESEEASLQNPIPNPRMELWEATDSNGTKFNLLKSWE